MVYSKTYHFAVPKNQKINSASVQSGKSNSPSMFFDILKLCLDWSFSLSHETVKVRLIFFSEWIVSVLDNMTRDTGVLGKSPGHMFKKVGVGRVEQSLLQTFPVVIP